MRYSHLFFLLLFSCQLTREDRVLFSGDSLVAGWSLFSYFGEYNYINGGVGGSTIRQVRDKLLQDVEIYKPDKIVILVGTNDLRPMVMNGYAEDIILDTANARFEDLFQYLEAYEKEYIVLGLLMVNRLYSPDYYARINMTFLKINTQLRNRIQKSAHGRFFDLNFLLCEDLDQLQDFYTTDGLHLTGNAYEIISNYLKEYILENY